VLRELWLWFMVPLGVSAISLAHAYGLSIMVSMYAYTSTKSQIKTTDSNNPLKSALEIFFAAVLVPLFIWVAGAICHYYM
jgi:hypothetical protein